MDIYRARTYARLFGVVTLLLAGAGLVLLQRSLVRMKDGPRSARIAYDPRDIIRSPDPDKVALELLGQVGYVAERDDLDGDGRPEIVVAARAQSDSPDETWIRRVAVLTSRGSYFGVMFDSDRSIDVPVMGTPVSYWRVETLTARSVDLEGLDATGRPLNQFLQLAWRPETMTYRRRVFAKKRRRRSPGTARPSPPRPASASRDLPATDRTDGFELEGIGDGS